MTSIVNTVIPVFLIIAIGFLIGKKKKLNLDAIVFLLIYITGPALIFSSLVKSELKKEDFILITLVTVGIVLIAGLIVHLLFKYKKIRHKGLYLPMTIGNTGYLGYPIALFAFGFTGLSIAVIYDNIQSLFLYSIGIFLIHHKNEWKEAFKVPLIWAVIVGLLFNLSKIQVPFVLSKTLEMIGLITIPLALMVLGYKLTEVKVKSFKIALLASLFKIFVLSGIAFLLITLFNVSGVIRNVILIQAAMPSAVMTMILCHKYKRDPGLVASVVFISTLISLVTIPLLLWLFV